MNQKNENNNGKSIKIIPEEKSNKKNDINITPRVELGLYPLQSKILGVIFDSCRDYAQHEVLKFDPKYGMWSQIRDPRQKLYSDFFISPNSLWRHRHNIDNNNNNIIIIIIIIIINISSTETSTSSLTSPSTVSLRTNLLSSNNLGEKSIVEKKEEKENPSILITYEVIYHKLKAIPKTHEVWVKLFAATPEYPVPQLEFHSYDRKSQIRAKPIIYCPPDSWADIIKSQKLGENIQMIERGLFTHGIWIPSCELTNALNRIDLMDDSRVTIGIRGNCLILFASQHGEEVAHIHGEPAIQDEWLTPYEEDHLPAICNNNNNNNLDLNLYKIQKEKEEKEKELESINITKNTITPTALFTSRKKTKYNDKIESLDEEDNHDTIEHKHSSKSKIRTTPTIPSKTKTNSIQQKVTNLPLLSLVCSLKINFCNKTSNNSSDHVLLVMSAIKPESGIIIYFPLREMKPGSFNRYIFAPPPSYSPHHHQVPSNYIPPEYFQCKLPVD